MIVTTAERPDAELIAQAKRLAGELQADYVPRRQDTLRYLADKHRADGTLVAARDGLKYVSDDQPPLFFHPSMGFVRVKRMLGGEGPDPMIKASGVAAGDTVMDCTAGLASDAILFSHVVGAAGAVRAIEASTLLYVIVREGLQSVRTGLPEVDDACRRVAMVQGAHEDILRGMPDRSVDVVYFDPMFGDPVQASAAIRPLRNHALHEPLAAAAVEEAVRVARKSVVMKNARGSTEFARLGFAPPRPSKSAVAYGVIRIDPRTG